MAEQPEKPSELEELSTSSQPSLIAEFVEFLRYNKKWWLLPILLLMGAFGLLMVAAGSGAAPFIYTLF